MSGYGERASGGDFSCMSSFRSSIFSISASSHKVIHLVASSPCSNTDAVTKGEGGDGRCGVCAGYHYQQTIIKTSFVEHAASPAVRSVARSARRPLALPPQPQQHLLVPVQIRRTRPSAREGLRLGVLEVDEGGDARPGRALGERSSEVVDEVGFVLSTHARQSVWGRRRREEGSNLFCRMDFSFCLL